jgi:hypothetical protein
MFTVTTNPTENHGHQFGMNAEFMGTYSATFFYESIVNDANFEII